MKKKDNLNNKNSSGHNGTNSILEQMGAVSSAIDAIFSRLQEETEDFAGTLINSFTKTESILAELIKLISALESGGGAGSLLELVPGGGLISGFIDLFTGFAGLFNKPAAPGPLNSFGQPDIDRAQHSGESNITVIVNSEIEKTKAVKFFKNYYPVYKIRESHSEA